MVRSTAVALSRCHTCHTAELIINQEGDLLLWVGRSDSEPWAALHLFVSPYWVDRLIKAICLLSCEDDHAIG